MLIFFLQESVIKVVLDTLGTINVPEKMVNALGAHKGLLPLECISLLQLLPSNKDPVDVEHLVACNLDTKLGDVIQLCDISSPVILSLLIEEFLGGTQMRFRVSFNLQASTVTTSRNGERDLSSIPSTPRSTKGMKLLPLFRLCSMTIIYSEFGMMADVCYSLSLLDFKFDGVKFAMFELLAEQLKKYPDLVWEVLIMALGTFSFNFFACKSITLIHFLSLSHRFLVGHISEASIRTVEQERRP